MSKFKAFFINSFLYYLAIELVEEILEDFIAMEISKWLIKVASTFITVAATYSFKTLVKATVKRVTYKEGNDKVNAIKKFFTLIWANKKSIIGTIASIFSGVTTFIATNQEKLLALPTINIGSFNITPVLAGLLVTGLTALGVTGKGFETITTFFNRKKAQALIKEDKKAKKLAKQECIAEDKAKTLSAAEAEAKEAKEAKDKAAAEAKAKADEAFRAKVEAYKAELRNTSAETTNQNITE